MPDTVQPDSVLELDNARVTRALFRSLGNSPQAFNVFSLEQPIIITIDGPAGTGKSSVARSLAKRLGLDFLDTGAMYRAAAAICIDHGIDPSDHKTLVEKVVSADLHFDWAIDPPAILAWGGRIDRRIRDADVTAIVSPISAIPGLRQHMVAKQRIIGRQHPRLVTEGRDQGSIVFPDAKVKFYLDASAKVRARRRTRQLLEAGVRVDETEELRKIIERDERDMSRADGPLRKPEGGTIVDTSDLEFDQVVAELERIVRAKAAEPD
ncbi:MAG: (d)CMP kinase [Phycisphaerae bacterium]|nr:(d)CMP kinase [Phycisphaerae bacterium]